MARYHSRSRRFAPDLPPARLCSAAAPQQATRGPWPPLKLFSSLSLFEPVAAAPHSHVVNRQVNVPFAVARVIAEVVARDVGRRSINRSLVDRPIII